jgi:hypothetical protein
MAQTRPERTWENLNRLQPKERIQVLDTFLRSYNGRYLSFTPEEFTMEADGKTLVLKRPTFFA